MMSLYAASNIAQAVQNYSDVDYARMSGLIQNSRNIESEDDLVDRAAEEMGIGVVHRLSRDPSVQRCEEKGMTVVEGEPDSPQADSYRELARKLLSLSEDCEGGMKIE
jgi:nitrogenase iron protein NifH